MVYLPRLIGRSTLHLRWSNDLPYGFSRPPILSRTRQGPIESDVTRGSGTAHAHRAQGIEQLPTYLAVEIGRIAMKKFSRAVRMGASPL